MKKLPEKQCGVRKNRGEMLHPEFLPFTREAASFILKGEVCADGEIRYEMTSGFETIVVGNQRPCSEFFGYQCERQIAERGYVTNLAEVLEAGTEKK